MVSDIYGSLYHSSRHFRLCLFMAGKTMGKTQRTENRLKVDVARAVLGTAFETYTNYFLSSTKHSTS